MKRLLCAFIAVNAILVFCNRTLAEDTWTINNVAYSMSGQPSVAVDMNNNPIMAFGLMPYTYSPALYTATQTDCGYQVDKLSAVHQSAWPRIAVTSNNELAMSFYDSSGFQFASKGGWFDWIFSRPKMQVAAMDMALTGDDVPHIAGIGGGYPYYIQHVFFNVQSQQWAYETLSGFGTITPPGGYLKIDATSNGRILICYLDNRNYSIRCAVLSNGYWNYLPTIVSAQGGDCGFTANGLPAVAYMGQDKFLYYAVYINDTIGWAVTQTNISFNGGGWISLKHSPTGAAGIAYSDVGRIAYAANIAGGWTSTDIDTFGGSTSFPDLIFDRNNKPLIVYNGIDSQFGNVAVIKLAGIGLKSININRSISGVITDRLIGLPIENAHVVCFSQTIGRELGNTYTDANGFYRFEDIPTGIVNINVYCSLYAPAGMSNITFSDDIENLDFALMPLGTLSGKVLDNSTGQPIANVPIDFKNLDIDNNLSTVSDANGDFYLAGLWPGLAQVKAKPDANSGYAWSLPWGSDFIVIDEGEDLSGKIIFLEKGALVHGYIKNADVNSTAASNFEFYCRGINCDVTGSTDVNGFYNIRLPKGTFSIQPYSKDNYIMLNSVFAVGAVNEVNMSDIKVYTSDTGDDISGDVNNSGGFIKDGRFAVWAFKAGTILNDPNMCYALTTTQETYLDSAGEFILDKLPPDVNYDIYLGVFNEFSDGRQSLTIRDCNLNAAIDTNNIDLKYDSNGFGLHGYVKNVNGQFVAGATAGLYDFENKFKGYCETDANGLYNFYNVPSGEYKITAVHSKYANASIMVLISVADSNAADIIMNFEGSKEGPDLNGDGRIDYLDIGKLGQAWLESGTNDCDFNQDGIVNFMDLIPIADNFLKKVIWLKE